MSGKHRSTSNLDFPMSDYDTPNSPSLASEAPAPGASVDSDFQRNIALNTNTGSGSFDLSSWADKLSSFDTYYSYEYVDANPLTRWKKIIFCSLGLVLLGSILAIGLSSMPSDTSKLSIVDSESKQSPPSLSTPSPTEVPDTPFPTEVLDTPSPTLSSIASPTSTPTMTTTSPTLTTTMKEISIEERLAAIALQAGSEFVDPESYHSKAVRYVINLPGVSEITKSQLAQKYALACFYFSTFKVGNLYTVENPPGWLRSDNWIGYSDECTWYGIVCIDGKVVSLGLPENNVAGTVPLELSLLGTTLLHLDLAGNPVFNIDEDMAWIEEMVELRELFLHLCNFDSNGITTYLGNLTKLEHLDISYTLMFGSFNSEVFKSLSNLHTLELGGNVYNEPIPDEIKNLPALENLYIENAQLKGDLSFLSSMEMIFELWIDMNEDISGTLPTELEKISSLASLSISECNLHGSIPAELQMLTSMQQLWLYGNQLSGGIPSEIVELKNLTTLRLESNRLNGTFPMSICQQIEFATLGTDCPIDVDCICCTCCGSPCNRSIIGTTDSEVTNESQPEVESIIRRIALNGGIEFINPRSPQSKALSWSIMFSDPSTIVYSSIVQRYALATFWYSTSSIANIYTGPIGWKNATGWLTRESECNWFGIECDNRGAITRISLPNNDVCGKVPHEIKILADTISYLDISVNPISSKNLELSWIGDMTELTTLDIHLCNFEFDGLPSYLSKLTKLEVLDVSYTLFFGPMNGNIFQNLTNLIYIDISGNSYSSSFPLELASQPSLKYAYAEFTHLSGDLSFINSMPAVIELWLDDNKELIGSIPSNMGNMKTLESVSLSNCSLTGTIPSEIGSMDQLKQLWLLGNNLKGTVPLDLMKLTNLEVLHVEDNDLEGSVPDGMCDLENLTSFAIDCEEVRCSCCTCGKK